MDLTRGQRLWFRSGLVRFNAGLLVHVVSGIGMVIGLAMMLPMTLAYVNADGAVAAFAIPGIPLLTIGTLAFIKTRPPSKQPLVRPRDVYLSVTSAWLMAGIFGMLPFLLNANFGTAPEAFFESMSGITTTGATVFDNVDDLRDSIKLWRSIMQWMGGIGIVVLFVGIAPSMGASAMSVFFAETGPAKEKLTPRIAQTAKLLVQVYLALSIAAFAAYRIAGMGGFDAVNHAMTSVATSGFSTRTGSIASFESTSIEIVAMIFMFLGGVNFAIYWSLAVKRTVTKTQLYELLTYASLIVVLSLVIMVSLLVSGDVFSLSLALRDSLFTTISVMTTTGYTVTDFDEWNDFARSAVLFLMFVGGCVGSTAGGIKVIRWMLLSVVMRQEANKLLHPRAVTTTRIGGRTYGETVRVGLLVFLALYLIIFAVSTLALSGMGVSLETAISASASTINLVGPALADAGASESYQSIPQAGMVLLGFNMLLGRLEIFTVLALLLPAFWRSR